jgi:hypothetical protein
MADRVFLPPKTQELHHLAHKAPLASGTAAVLVTQAVEHEKNRLNTIAETLAMIGLLTHHKVLHGNEVVTVRGATFQWVSGSRGEQTQGAHCLPGWIHFNSQPVHEMDSWNIPGLRDSGLKPYPFAIKVRNLGARVDLMGEMINVSDSYIEKMSRRRGLKDGLRRAVEMQTQALLRRPGRTADVIREVLNDVIANYRFIASYACEERLDDLAANLRDARDATAIARLKDKKLVIETYISALRDRSFHPEAVTDDGFEDIRKDVVA